MNLMWIPIFVIGLYHLAVHATECTTRGKFPNMLANDCRGYTMCLNVVEKFTQIHLICPENSTYSHLHSQCTNVTTYKCLPEYNCTQLGKFPSPSDCGSYISCVEALGIMVTARLVECPPDTQFNPIENACVNTTLSKCDLTTPAPPKVFEYSVKDSSIPSNKIPRNEGYYLKSYLVIYPLFVSLVLLKHIIICVCKTGLE